MEERNTSFVRAVLQHEITWLIFLVGAIMAFVYNVIIPMNSIQIQLLQIQQDISAIRDYDARITQNSNDIIILKEQVKKIHD